MSFKIACVQTNSHNNVAANITDVSRLVNQAVDAGAALVALPENVFYMADPATKREDVPLYTAANHPGVLAMQQLAKARNVWILIGSIAVEGTQDGKRLNCSVLINNEGAIVAEYDKIHLFDVDLGNGEKYMESGRFEAGAEAVVVGTPFGKLGLTICYDVRFPHLYRTLAQAGAQLLFVPAAFTAKTGEVHWHTLLRARAIETGCYVIAPAQCGIHPGERKTFGHSLVIDPWGTVLADGGIDVGVTMAEVDLAKVDEVRASLPSLQHDRDFTLKTF